MISHSDLASYIITIHLNSELSFIPTFDWITKLVGKLSTSRRSVEYDEPFNDNSSAQTVGIDVNKYCGTLTIIIAVNQRKR